jgi:YbbR domain-containing protein
MKIKMSENFGLKILSLAIAFILWFIVGNINDPVTVRTISDIPVQIINEDVLESINKVYEITEGDTVSVTARGKSSIVKNLKASDFTATADLSKLSIVDAVPIDISLSSRDANQVDLTLGKVNTVKVKIEDRTEVMLPVTVETVGNVRSGYAIGSKTSSPNLVEVSGSETVINKLKEIRVQVDVDNAYKDISTRQSVKFYDQNGDQVESASIECETAAVDVNIELWQTKEIPVVMETDGNVASGYGVVTFEYEPKTVTVAASDEDLEKLTEITLDPLDVSGKKESLEKTITLDTSILPKGVIFQDNTVDLVAKAVIEKKINREISLSSSDITVKGLKTGEKATFGANSYTIRVESYASKISDITGIAFEPYINVSEIDEDTGRVLVHLTNPNGVTVTNKIYAEVKVD